MPEALRPEKRIASLCSDGTVPREKSEALNGNLRSRTVLPESMQHKKVPNICLLGHDHQWDPFDMLAAAWT